MTLDNSPSEFLTWSVESRPLRVLYTSAVMNQMAEAAWEGLKRIPRRGLEIGGVLYGTRLGDEVRILQWRPIECEHARGPGFDLSERDQEALAAVLQQEPAEPELSGMEPVGWFHTHTRDGIFLSAKDVDIYNRFFPEPWQIALVLKPHQQEPLRGGFFFREENGSIKATASYQEFTLGRRSRHLPVGFDPSNPLVRSVGRERPIESEAPRPVAPVPPAPAPVQRPEPVEPPAPLVQEPPEQKPPPRRWVAVLVALLFVVAAIVILGLPLVDSAPKGGFAMAVHEIDGHLGLEWDHTAAATLAAERGVIQIVDGGSQYRIDVSREELHTGYLTYAHETGEVEFRLDLIPSNGEPVSEVARFLGESPAGNATGPESLAQRLELEAQAGRLRQRLEQETARNKELRDRVQILQQKLSGTTPAGNQPRP